MTLLFRGEDIDVLPPERLVEIIIELSTELQRTRTEAAGTIKTWEEIARVAVAHRRL